VRSFAFHFSSYREVSLYHEILFLAAIERRIANHDRSVTYSRLRILINLRDFMKWNRTCPHFVLPHGIFSPIWSSPERCSNMIRAKRKKETKAERWCRNYPCVGQPLLNERTTGNSASARCSGFPGTTDSDVSFSLKHVTKNGGRRVPKVS